MFLYSWALQLHKAYIVLGPVAQWIRHRPTEPGIAGSSPAGVIVETRVAVFEHMRPLPRMNLACVVRRRHNIRQGVRNSAPTAGTWHLHGRCCDASRMDFRTSSRVTCTFRHPSSRIAVTLVHEPGWTCGSNFPICFALVCPGCPGPPRLRQQNRDSTSLVFCVAAAFALRARIIPGPAGATVLSLPCRSDLWFSFGRLLEVRLAALLRLGPSAR